MGAGAKLEYSVVVDNNLNSNNKPYTIKLPTNQNNNLKNRPVTASSLQDESAIKNPFIIPGIQKLNIDPQLKQDNTFDNFIEGECNRLARSAGYAVCTETGRNSI